jgi:hypothetical protein
VTPLKAGNGPGRNRTAVDQSVASNSIGSAITHPDELTGTRTRRVNTVNTEVNHWIRCSHKNRPISRVGKDLEGGHRALFEYTIWHWPRGTGRKFFRTDNNPTEIRTTVPSEHKTSLNVAVERLALLIRIREVQGWNLGPGIGYPVYRGFLQNSRQMPKQFFKLGLGRFLPCSFRVIIRHGSFRRYIVTSLNQNK